ncbi:MAG: arsenite methyltransferase [Melioribacteraceae bacterium]|nr:arsenite methyltransferase [Melioribacteraceae bacterium]
MKHSEELKDIVKNKYSQIALNPGKRQKCGCCDSKNDYSIISDEYSGLEGYVKEADLNLGCGIPTKYAGISSGDTVVDLGSGAGNDAFVARALVGENGRVIGIDFTEEMIAKAELNNTKLGYSNVEFKLGEIENLPLDEKTADVVISNCVLNLVPDKNKAFNEIFRILKTGGHFCVSDIVLFGKLPEGLKESATAYAGCVSGAIPQEEYLRIISSAGFNEIEVKISKDVDLPEDLLCGYLSEQEKKEYDNKEFGIISITVTGNKLMSR